MNSTNLARTIDAAWETRETITPTTKGAAREAVETALDDLDSGNQILGLTGQAFWQEESYDHWVRDGKEFDRLRAYIEKNPVKAGLVKAPEHYPWSSATKEQAGQGAGCGPGGTPHPMCSQMLAQM